MESIQVRVPMCVHTESENILKYLPWLSSTLFFEAESCGFARLAGQYTSWICLSLPLSAGVATGLYNCARLSCGYLNLGPVVACSHS